MKKLTIFYIQYSGVWGTWTSDATGDIESVEVPYHTSKLNVEYNLILPGLKSKNHYKTKNVKVHLTPVPVIKESPLCIILHNLFSIILALIISLRKKINLVHAFPNTSFAGLVISKILRVPLITQFYDINVDETATNKRISASLYIKIKDALIKKSDGAIANSRGIKNYLANDVRIAEIVCIPPGINCARFLECKIKNKNKKNKTLIYAGTLHRARELHYLVYAFKEVLQKKPNTSLVFVGLGTGLDDLKKLAHKLGVAHKVIFTGYILPNDVPSYIAGADIGISYVPKKLYDWSPPLKTLEYMILAKPTVATITETHKEYLKNDENCILVKDGDVKALSSAILKFLNNPKFAKKCGLMAQKLAKTFDWRVKAAQYRAFYDRVLEVCA